MIDEQNQDWSRSIVRFGLIALVASLIIFWLWAFFLAPSGNPDRIEDRAGANSAENLCAEFREKLSDLPLASTAESPESRASMIEEVNVLLDS